MKEPILYRLVKDYDVAPNVRRANILANEAWMVLEIEADSERQIGQAIDFLRGMGVSVEAVEGDFMES